MSDRCMIYGCSNTVPMTKIRAFLSINWLSLEMACLGCLDRKCRRWKDFTEREDKMGRLEAPHSFFNHFISDDFN